MSLLLTGLGRRCCFDRHSLLLVLPEMHSEVVFVKGRNGMPPVWSSRRYSDS